MTEINQELFKKIRQIEFQTKQLADDLLAGAYHSAFKGRGMEFEEVREYQDGDEIRTIDWNVTARMNHPYVKTFKEERDLTVMLMVDVSSSSKFGSLFLQKSALIAEIGAVIAFSAIKNNDKIGLILFSDQVEKYLPPRKGTRHVLRIIRELLAFTPKRQGTDIEEALSFLGKVQRRSSICFLLSDFMSGDFSHAAKIIAQEHDLIAIQIVDPYEIDLPEKGLWMIQDLESSQAELIDTSSSQISNQFKEHSKERLANQKHIFEAMGAGLIEIRTDQPYLPAMKKFFKIRAQRQR